MRDDQVFRLGPKPTVGEGARVIDLDGEVMWLVSDLMRLRGYNDTRNLETELLMHIPEGDIEQVWVVAQSGDQPAARWVVTADGASVVHDYLAARKAHARKRRSVRASLRGPAAPAWKAAGLNPYTPETEEETPDVAGD